MDKWQEVVQSPLRWLNDEILGELLGGVGDESSRRELVGLDRFQYRLSARTRGFFQLNELRGIDDPRPEDAAVYDQLTIDAKAFVQRLGACCFARSFAMEVRSAKVKRLKELIGEDGFRFAMKFVDDVGMETIDLDDLEQVPNTIELAGQGCLAVWIGQQPLSLIKWLSMMGICQSSERLDAMTEWRKNAGPQFVRKVAVEMGKQS